MEELDMMELEYERIRASVLDSLHYVSLLIRFTSYVDHLHYVQSGEWL